MSETLTSDDIEFMREALHEAKLGLSEGEAPIGAVAVRNGKVIARGHNQRRVFNDITAHAEMMCLRKVGPFLENMDLSDITIYSTLEPCAMCVGAMVHYNAGRVVYGAKDLKLGASKLLIKKGIPTASGVLDQECRDILYRFFKHEIGEDTKCWGDIEVK